MKKILLPALAVVLSSGAASAEMTYGNFFIKRHNLDASGSSVDLDTLGGAVEVMTNGWTFSGDAGRYDLEGVGDVTLGSVGVSYGFASGISIGLDHARIDADGVMDADLTSIFGIYDGGNYAIGLSVGDSDDLTDHVISVFGSWDVNETSRIGLDIMEIEDETLVAGYADYAGDRYELSADVISTDGFDFAALGGSFKVSEKFSVTGTIGRFDLLGVDGNSFSIGGEYEFAPGWNVGLGVGRIDVDGLENIDVVSIGLNFETGNKRSSRRSVSTIVNQATRNFVGATSF